MTLSDAYVLKRLSQRNENEYYPTPAIATLSLLRNVDVPSRIWECAAGRGHISKELIRNHREVVSSDLFEYPEPMVPIETGVDFLKAERKPVDGVITNPPFKDNLPEKLIYRMLEHHEYSFFALFCRLTFMESARRYPLFKKHPPSKILALSQRVNCNERYFDVKNGIGGMVAYSFFVWDYREERTKPGDTRVQWVMPSDYIDELNDIQE